MAYCNNKVIEITGIGCQCRIFDKGEVVAD